MSVSTSRRTFVLGRSSGDAAGIIERMSMAGDRGHLGHLGSGPLAFAPKRTYQDFTGDFETVDPGTGKEQA
jgi:hypothetical protein